jgi:hypothetical protein
LREEVVSMLMALGVTGAADDPLLDIVIRNVQYRVQNETNRADLPDGLKSVAVYMAVGEYLNMKKVSGQLEGFDLDAAIKQIQEGDTNTVFAIGDGSSTPEQRLDALISYLINGRTREFYRFRRFVW